MGCGKSTLMCQLANKLQLNAIDLDTYIEQREKKSINEIFASKGDVYFRKKETQYLEEILHSEHYPIVAMGGGTPCFGKNMDLILKHSDSFYLKATSATLFKRLVKQKTKRPLIADIPTEALENFIQKHLFERNIHYNRAKFKVSIDGKNIEEIAKKIIQKINKNTAVF